MALVEKYEDILAALSRCERVIELAEQDGDETTAFMNLDVLSEIAHKWHRRVTDLRNALARREYTVSINDLDGYAEKFSAFLVFASERKSQLGGL